MNQKILLERLQAERTRANKMYNNLVKTFFVGFACGVCLTSILFLIIAFGV